MLLFIMFLGFIALFLGYKFYSPYVMKQLNFDETKETPAYKYRDDVDYMPISTNKNMMIQLLNIAGTGPVFGPIMAALFGPISLILIPLGNIFAGAVMDLGFGVISMKNKGMNFPAIAIEQMGRWSKWPVTIFSCLLLLLVGTVFVVTPASLMNVTFFDGSQTTHYIIVSIIFAYYIMATVMPIDKIIARYYPYLTALLLIGTLAIFISLLVSTVTGGLPYGLPPIDAHGFIAWSNPRGTLLWPGFIVAVSCGFISGFHTTQTPIVAKTLKDGRHVRKTFYGMMSVEGGIALVWAFASIVLFTPISLSETMHLGTQTLVVSEISNTTLGPFAFLLVLAVVILPITSGDTAFRSLRSIVAEVFNIPQEKVKSRIIMALPVFTASVIAMQMGFQPLWNYFTWSNHMLSIMSLIMITGYLKNQGTNYWITLVPMLLLFSLNMLYLFNDAGIGFGLEWNISAILGTVVALLSAYFFLRYSRSWQGKVLDEFH